MQGEHENYLGTKFYSNAQNEAILIQNELKFVGDLPGVGVVCVIGTVMVEAMSGFIA